jgi:hypothetical protein
MDSNLTNQEAQINDMGPPEARVPSLTQGPAQQQAGYVLTPPTKPMILLEPPLLLGPPLDEPQPSRKKARCTLVDNGDYGLAASCNVSICCTAGATPLRSATNTRGRALTLDGTPSTTPRRGISKHQFFLATPDQVRMGKRTWVIPSPKSPSLVSENAGLDSPDHSPLGSTAWTDTEMIEEHALSLVGASLKSQESSAAGHGVPRSTPVRMKLKPRRALPPLDFISLDGTSF